VTERRVIVISDREPGLPYSKGLAASELMVTGLSPFRAYEVAERVEERLLERRVLSVTAGELDDLTATVLAEVVGERYADNWAKWREIGNLDVPLVLMIGGATGVGKSTIATQLAVRLGIVRVTATDAIREVMRSLFSEELMPTLYRSSFNADAALREPPPRPADRVIVGFREQTATVAVGIRALVDRAALEGTSVVIEGAHVVPGYFDLSPFEDRVLGVPVIVTVEDEALHRTHFALRATESSTRPTERYVQGFDNIRRVQKYIKSQALSHNVPVVPNYSLDQALAAVLDLVMARATERIRARTRQSSHPHHPPRRSAPMEATP
jgi:2-phosphoglycerate kinase